MPCLLEQLKLIAEYPRGGEAIPFMLLALVAKMQLHAAVTSMLNDFCLALLDKLFLLAPISSNVAAPRWV